MKIEQQSACATQENAGEDRYKGQKWPPESRCIGGGARITQNATPETIYSEKAVNTSVPLVPPKPKEFDMAVQVVVWRASLAT